MRLLDLAEVLPRGVPFVAVGNLPYFAATHYPRRILEGEPRPRESVFMVQREVGREIAAKPEDASLLAISVQVYAVTELLFDVPPEAFDPRRPPCTRRSCG